MRAARLVQIGALGLVAAGTAWPHIRRKIRPSVPLTLGTGTAAPFAVTMLMRRSRFRDALIVFEHMMLYFNLYTMPYDDPDALKQRVHIDYPIRLDRIIGLGKLPTVRMQEFLSGRKHTRKLDIGLSWVYWLWFLTPYLSMIYVLLFHRKQFPRVASMVCTTFDLGAAIYWGLPTAPPWYAKELGHFKDSEMSLRRLQEQRGREIHDGVWSASYDALGGNPLAAMPSLHFAVSVMCARMLSDCGRGPGAVAWTYAGLLGFAIIYLGEHYIVDVLAGYGLTELVRSQEQRFTPLYRAVSDGMRELEQAVWEPERQ